MTTGSPWLRRGEPLQTIRGRCDALAVLTDLRLKGLDGFEILYEIIQRHPACNVLMLTAFGTVESTVEARNQGALDSLTKPINTEELSVPIEKAFREACLRQEVAERRKQVRREDAFAHVLGNSEVMRAVFEFMRRVADAPTNLLSPGESGTGQELGARAIPC